MLGHIWDIHDRMDRISKKNSGPWVHHSQRYGPPKYLKMLMFRTKKINVAELISLIYIIYTMHVILKWPQYCFFKNKFDCNFHKKKSYRRRILFGGKIPKWFLKTHRFRSIFTWFFKNSSEKSGQTDYGEKKYFGLTSGLQNGKNNQKIERAFLLKGMITWHQDDHCG